MTTAHRRGTLRAVLSAFACGALLGACGSGDPTQQPNTEMRASGLLVKASASPVAGPDRLAGLACSGNNRTGWCWLQSENGWSAIQDVFFLDAQHGWRVGGGGRVERTQDGGLTWSRLNTGHDIDLTRIVFSSDRDGLAFGTADAAMTTHDGGQSWSLSRLQAPEPLLVQMRLGNFRLAPLPSGALAMVDQPTQRLAPAEADEWIALSHDGGVTWQTMPNLSGRVLTTRGRVLGIESDRYLRVSDDGGRTWVTRGDFGELPRGVARWGTLSQVGDRHLFYSRYFGDPTDGHITTELWVSHDDGKTWAARRQSEERVQLVILGTGVVDTTLLACNVPGSSLLEPKPDACIFQLSTDDGATWSVTDAATAARLRTSPAGPLRLFMTDAETGVQLWRRLETSDHPTVPITHPLTGSQRWHFATRLVDLNDGSMLVRTPEGPTFLAPAGGQPLRLVAQLPPQGIAAPASAVRSAWFFDGNRGLGIDGDDHLVQSNDGGRTWSLATSDLGPRFLSPKVADLPVILGFSDAQNGWARLSEASVMRTRDGGLHWSYVESDASPDWIRPVPFIAAGSLLLLGETQGRWIAAVRPDGGLAYSDDQGAHWQYVHAPGPGPMRRVTSSSDRVLWAAGANATLLKSVDRGQSWELVLSGAGGDLNDIAFIDEQRGWAVGQAGLVLATQDGGKTWVKQDSGTTRDLTRVQFTGPNTGWITAAGNVLLMTGTGGY